jgi:hypothetical protein
MPRNNLNWAISKPITDKKNNNYDFIITDNYRTLCLDVAMNHAGTDQQNLAFTADLEVPVLTAY